MVRILSHIDAEILAEPMPFGCERVIDSGFGRLITMENWHDEASKEHGLPLVRWRRRGGGAFLHQDLILLEFYRQIAKRLV